MQDMQRAFPLLLVVLSFFSSHHCLCVVIFVSLTIA